MTFKGHMHGVRNVALSNDGSRLASTAEDKTVRIWDANTGICLAIIEGFVAYTSGIVLSQNAQGLFLAVGSEDGSVRYFQIKTLSTLQKTEVRMLWNSHQRSLYLSGAQFEGAMLSSRNATLVTQRGAKGKPREIIETLSVATTVAASATAAVGSAAAVATASTATPTGVSAVSSNTQLSKEKEESEKTMLFQHKTSALSLTPKQRLDQALQSCMTAIDKKAPSPAIALRRAVGLGKEDVVKTLLDCSVGLDIDQQSEETGQTVLHLAVLKRKKKVIKILLEAGAGQDIADFEDKKTVDYAKESGDPEIEALFKPKVAIFKK